MGVCIEMDGVHRGMVDGRIKGYGYCLKQYVHWDSYGKG